LQRISWDTTLAASDALVREAGPAGRDAKFFYIIPLTDMLIFATLILFAFRARSNPSAHKRLILVATVALLIAAIAAGQSTLSTEKLRLRRCFPTAS